MRRYQTVCAAVFVGTSVPYLWVLWDLWNGSIDPLRRNGGDSNPIYDVQARAIMHGHLWIPNGSIGTEAFVSKGHQYTYFGVFPSLLRIPIFIFTSSFDGRLFSLSILGAWLVTAIFCSLLIWRVRILLRGDAHLGWLETASYGLVLISILVGSVLIYLASRPNAYNEDEAWSVALFCGCLFALLGMIERPSWRRITFCCALVLFTNLNRGTTGYAAILATLLIAIWFAFGCVERRRWSAPLAIAGLLPLAIGSAIDFAKFGVLFGVPFSRQELFQEFRLQAINQGHYLSLHWLPITLGQYVNPANFSVSSLFPYFVLPNAIASSHSFGGDPTASILISMPFLCLSAVWGIMTTFMPGRSSPQHGMRFLLIAAAVPAAAMMIYGWIFERFVADFMPLLVMAGTIGIVDVWRRIDSRARSARIGVLLATSVLIWLGVWTNVAFAITPTFYWNRTQAGNFVNTMRDFSDLTGHPISRHLVIGAHYPASASWGTLFVKGHCAALYIANADLTPHGLPLFVFLPVERAPRTPICHSLVGNR